MRMRKKNIKNYFLKKKRESRNSEGGIITTYENPVLIEAEVWSANGRVQAEMYGQKLRYIKNMLYEGSEDIEVDDGVCIYVSSDELPDYRVISIKDEHLPKIIELEKI